MSKMEVMETNHGYMRKPPERSPQYGSEGFRAGEHVEVWGVGVAMPGEGVGAHTPSHTPRHVSHCSKLPKPRALSREP